MEQKPAPAFDPSDRKYYLFALRVVGDFGANIAVPVVILVLLGQYLEKRYGFAPYGTVAGFVLAATISGVLIFRKAKEYGTQYQELIKKK
jgi:hypothetical protein